MKQLIIILSFFVLIGCESKNPLSSVSKSLDSLEAEVDKFIERSHYKDSMHNILVFQAYRTGYLQGAIATKEYMFEHSHQEGSDNFALIYRFDERRFTADSLQFAKILK